MAELLKIYFLPSNIRTCFFYRNNLKNYKESFGNVWGIKINYGKNYELTSFGSISLQPLAEIPDKSIGITCLLAHKLNLKEDDQVLISNFFPSSLEAVEIIVHSEEDYNILLNCKSFVEEHLLNQMRIISEGQVLPLHLFGNIHIYVEIGKCKPVTKCGQLENFTEVTILNQLQEMSCSRNKSSATPCLDRTKVKEIHDPNIFVETLNKLFYKNESNNKHNKLKPYFSKYQREEDEEYFIWPKLLLPDDLDFNILDKFIVVLNNENKEKSFGPYCRKVLCKVLSDCDKDSEDDHNLNDKSDIVQNNNFSFETINGKVFRYFFSYVIFLNNSCISNKKKIFCSSFIMRKLKVFVGSKLKIKESENKVNESLLFIDQQFMSKKETWHFWKNADEIIKSVINNLMNNIKFNHKLNTLIIGCVGSGKTSLLDVLEENLGELFIYFKTIKCKSIQGKKLEVQFKMWSDTLKECCYHEPSVLFIDDLNALINFDEEEGPYNKLFSKRLVEMITKCIEEVQENFNVTVVATATTLENLNNFVFTHGPRLFQDVKKIECLSLNDRMFALSQLIDSKTCDLVDLNKIGNSTNGYTIQDLNDLVNKATLKCLVKNKNSVLNQRDFDLALSESTPLLLKNVKLKKNIHKKWEDVGGMDEPKQILIEVFSWPSKYPELLESCPLRLHKGVLLYGAPGTGKTLLAGAVANKCGLNFISVKGPEVLSKYVGASEEGIRNLFNEAQKTQPCLLFFDEFDSLAPKRDLDSTGVTDRVVNQLLTQLDGVEPLNGVWVLAATSRPDLLDPALLRPGRFDKMVFCRIPNEDDRLLILTVLSQNITKDENLNLEMIAKESNGYTGADLKALLYNAQMLASKSECDLTTKLNLKVKQEHLVEALKTTKPSLTFDEKAKYKKIYDKFINSRKKNCAKGRIDAAQKVTFA